MKKFTVLAMARSPAEESRTTWLNVRMSSGGISRSNSASATRSCGARNEAGRFERRLRCTVVPQ